MMSRTRVTRLVAPHISCSLLIAGFLATTIVAGSGFVAPPIVSAQPRSLERGPAPSDTTSPPVRTGVAVSTVEVALNPLWRGPDGQPLPFMTHGEVIDFLRSAKVVSRTVLPSGWTRPQKLLLEKDGIRLHTIFRTFDREQGPIEDPLTGQSITGNVKDSAMFEVAAYELAMLLDLPLVPPTVRRIIDNRDGTLQLWIEAAMSEKQRREQGIEPLSIPWWHGIMQTLTIFDNLVSNADRHSGNLLIDADWGVWFIDHTLAFQTRRDIPRLKLITFCERRLWERLRTVSDDRVVEQLAPYLNGREIGSLLSRRDRLVKHFEGLIAEKGIDAVIYDYSHDVADWRHSWPS